MRTNKGSAVPYLQRMKYVVAISIGSALLACSGDVNVHGVPKQIELQAPFCAPPPPVDAGVDADLDAGDEQ